MMNYYEAYGLHLGKKRVRLINEDYREKKKLKLHEVVEGCLSSDLLYPTIALIVALCIIVMLYIINSKLNRIMRNMN